MVYRPESRVPSEGRESGVPRDVQQAGPSDRSTATGGGRHALVVLVGAGWHKSKALEWPHNVSLLHLPPYSPELNPVETVFQFLKARYFANQVFATAVVKKRVSAVWSDSIQVPDRITSLGTRAWANLTLLGTQPLGELRCRLAQT